MTTNGASPTGCSTWPSGSPHASAAIRSGSRNFSKIPDRFLRKKTARGQMAGTGPPSCHKAARDARDRNILVWACRAVLHSPCSMLFLKGSAMRRYHSLTRHALKLCHRAGRRSMASRPRALALAATLAAAALPAAPVQADENVMVVFDGSNSMWGQIDGVAKIEIARDVMGNLLGSWADERNVGLMAYGHRQRGDCSDIEVLVQPGQAARQTILDRVGAITPTGKTPLTDAVEQAARTLSYTDQPATVVLISDGLESCERDPCALAEALERGGVAFTAHVVGFGLASGDDAGSLACIAEKTGGEYISAANAEELGKAFDTVGAAVADAAPEPEPEPAPEPEAPAVTVTGPETAIGGSQVTVTWEPTLDAGDYINIVPFGSEPDDYGSYKSVRDNAELNLTAPGAEGLYEIRYIHRASGEVRGTDALEITRPEVTLSAGETVQTGAGFDVSWTPTINTADYVTIVPLGADEGEFGDYLTVRDNTEGALVAPAAPGLYEIRYVLKIDRSTVAARQIEVTEPEVTLQVPEAAETGAAFDVSWSAAVNSQDYITIVPMGADEGEFGNYVTVRDDTTKSLKAPAEPGMYEVRYVLREGRKTMASEPIEITEASVEVSGPSSVITGSEFDVSWTETINTQDYITILPAGSAEGEFGNYITVRDKMTGKLTAPADPGLYELRYILREGRKTIASAAIEVTEPEVTVSAPETALTGAMLEVSWTGTVSTRDYVTIVPIGTEEGEFGNYITVRDKTAGGLQAPADTGLYELRYILREGRKTIATAMVEIVAPEVTISAPGEVRAGEELKATWTGTVNSRDYINFVPAGAADDEFGDYTTVRDKSAHDITAPEEPGLYEVRYILREGRRVLARATVEVLPEDAQLSTGAAIDAPESAGAGSTIEVSWTIDETSADQRITVARGNQAIFTWLSARKITGAPPMEITLPEEPGVYELRILDVANKKVLARKTISLE
ncbi:VWA domain-containing protein [Rhodobacteraceae bacterium 63075]|nr:VWA domain-containing protein [Rhodobacteraceae bacterium 63075]